MIRGRWRRTEEVFETLELPNDERSMSPRASEGDLKTIRMTERSARIRDRSLSQPVRTYVEVVPPLLRSKLASLLDGIPEGRDLTLELAVLCAGPLEDVGVLVVVFGHVAFDERVKLGDRMYVRVGDERTSQGSEGDAVHWRA